MDRLTLTKQLLNLLILVYITFPGRIFFKNMFRVEMLFVGQTSTVFVIYMYSEDVCLAKFLLMIIIFWKS